MATRQLFVSEEYLRDNLPISRNLDAKTLIPNVQMSEELYIQEILGSGFYESLYNAFINQNLTSDEITLIQDYIKPAEAYIGLFLALPFSRNLISNKGVQQQKEDYSNPSDFQEFKMLLTLTEKRAEFYKDRLNKYLCLNSALFPLYRNQTNNVIQPNNNNNLGSGVGFY